jgi:hypothetical protein
MSAPPFRACRLLAACVASVGLIAACTTSRTAAPAAPPTTTAWSAGPGWHTRVVLSQPGREALTLHGLACPSPDQCAVAGLYAPDASIVPFVMTGLTSGRPPVIVTLHMPADKTVTDTIDLACSSPGNCAAVGTYTSPAGRSLSNGFTAAESGGHWAAAQPVAPPAGSEGISSVRGVACTSPGNCVAVGSAYNGAFEQVPIVVTESGGTWGRAAYIGTPQDYNGNLGADLFSVACASAGSCVAVGSYAVTSGLVSWPMAAVESGGRWLRAQKIPLPADADLAKKVGEGSLSSVSCAPGGTCLAVGGYAVNAAGTDHGLAVTEEDGHFGPIAERPQELDSVTCTPRFCLSSSTSTSYAGHVLSYSGGRWSQLEPIQPPASLGKATLPDEGLSDAQVACFADGRCAALSTFDLSSRTGGQVNVLLSTRN